jgi:hypothetical protein
MSIGDVIRTALAMPASIAMSLAGGGENPRTIGLLVGIASITAGVVLHQAVRRIS